MEIQKLTKKDKKPVIIIDGTVGCGKTTIARLLHKNLELKLYEELGNPDTISLLDEFYRDQKRWSFTLQIHFLNERFRMIKEIHKNNGGILDRSIFGDKIFAEMLNEDGMMMDEEYRTYTTLLDNMLEHAQSPKLLVYLKCDVDTAVERINSRDRGEESTVPRIYWERLNEKYDKWYNEYDFSKKIIINADEIDLTNDNCITEICQQVKHNYENNY